VTPLPIIICTLLATFWIGVEAGRFWEKLQDYRRDRRYLKMRGPTTKGEE